jgi:hypothetical protein
VKWHFLQGFGAFVFEKNSGTSITPHREDFKKQPIKQRVSYFITDRKPTQSPVIGDSEKSHIKQKSGR